MRDWRAAVWLCAAVCLTSLTFAGPSLAAESNAVTSKRTVATLISDTDEVAAGVPLHLALRLRLAAGWHTYWRNPGDAGVAPTVDVTLQPPANAGAIQWPTPQRIAEGPLTTYAYTGDVVLPFTIASPGQSGLGLHAHAEWLTCRDICVPEEATFDLLLPAGVPGSSAQAGLIADALARVPTPFPSDATITRDGQLTLSDAKLPSGDVSVEFFPAEVGSVDHATSKVLRADAAGLTVQIEPAAPGEAQQDRSGVVAIRTPSGLVQSYTVYPKAIAPPQSSTLLSPLLLLALGGGLLLNLMPCVFPILAMKAIALTRLSGADRRRVRGEAASYCGGVILAFVALGTGLVALRAGGEASGWGFQFQSPAFVTGVAWLLFAIGLSLSGVFEIGTSLMGRGDALARRGGSLGSFLTGVLAVVVATPCTAPFMGTAIAGALALPNLHALAVFGMLGVGMALPYALFAVVPSAARMLPRPGRWMRTLQQLLAFPMYGAAVWLVWVVSQQAGPAGVLATGAGFVAVGFAAWVLGASAELAKWGRRIATATALGSIACLAALLYGVAPGQGAAEPAEPFTTARLEQLRNEGRPVFVNMTAAWCLSCLVNERVALSHAAVRDAFAKSNVAYLKGDWTSQNPSISAYLHQLGQDGVPLYALYPPGRGPVILPQLLSEGAMLNELGKLRG